jgi:glucosamine--fructose-6-phosphate aminotransferase (isomerizing)
MEMAERQGYPHFMLKEIYEQPAAVRNTLGEFLEPAHNAWLPETLPSADILRNAQQILIVACGTSLHAGLIGKYMIERLTGTPVEVDYASEFRYRHPIIRPGTVAIAISQSGETADTLGALRYAREKGAFAIAVCNVVGSMAARHADFVLHTKAGPEIGVASTKAFTSQLVVLYALAVYMGQLRKAVSRKEFERRIELLKSVPDQMETVLSGANTIGSLAELISRQSQALYLGRGINYPIALEGALKLKEISYINAQGYPAGEMKHGPIALIDSHMPVVVVAPRDPLYRKTLSNLEEVRVRGGIIVAVASECDREIAMVSDHVVRIPGTDPLLNPLLAALPLQLLAYHAAVIRGCDVDKPRNLAKSVTVE